VQWPITFKLPAGMRNCDVVGIIIKSAETLTNAAGEIIKVAPAEIVSEPFLKKKKKI
jgi:hypothetical protein